MTSRSGAWLERLVGRIESGLAPHGFKVEYNTMEYQGGTPSAEFDVVISGKVGSVSIRMLFECRDRPTEGPAPASWIEQLVGRRGRFNFDTVVAVSTSGFAKPAIAYAQEKGIVLRTVTTLGELPRTFTIRRLRCRMRSVVITRLPTLQAGEAQPRPLEMPLLVRRPGQAQFGSLERLIAQQEVNRDVLTLTRALPDADVLNAMDQADLMETVIDFMSRHVSSSGRAGSYTLEGKLEALIDDRVVSLEKLDLMCTASHTDLDADFVLLHKYDGDRSIGAELTFRLAWEGSVYPIKLLLLDNSDGTQTLTLTAPPNAPIAFQKVLIGRQA